MNQSHSAILKQQFIKLINNNIMKYLLLAICFIFTSCGSLKDHNSFNDFFTEEENNLIFKLDASNARPASHNGKLYYPKSYEIKLPKKIKDFDLYYTKCTFKYPQDQFIIIFNDMVGSPVENDTIYTDRDKEVIDHVLDLLPYKYYYYNIGQNRKNIMLKRGTFTIYLLNIKDSNENEYIRLVKSFKINDSVSDNGRNKFK